MQNLRCGDCEFYNGHSLNSHCYDCPDFDNGKSKFYTSSDVCGLEPFVDCDDQTSVFDHNFAILEQTLDRLAKVEYELEKLKKENKNER